MARTNPAHRRLDPSLSGMVPRHTEPRANETFDDSRWHYIITGPESTPYHGGQYWGTLTFPSNYPFAPPAIRMHTPSGRFQPSTRLCLSISDFHPKSFNPAWSVSTILIGLLSFMTSDEMTTGSVACTEAERRFFAARSRWWNSTGGGSHPKCAMAAGLQAQTLQKGNVKAGDGGLKFREEWPAEDAANWAELDKGDTDLATGNPVLRKKEGTTAVCGPRIERRIGSGGGAEALREAMRPGQAVANANQGGFLQRNSFWLLGGAIFIYVLVARLVGEGS